jgi:hypothetical protein
MGSLKKITLQSVELTMGSLKKVTLQSVELTMGSLKKITLQSVELTMGGALRGENMKPKTYTLKHANNVFRSCLIEWKFTWLSLNGVVIRS